MTESREGPTGLYPQGKIHENDEGQLAYRVGSVRLGPAYGERAGPAVVMLFGTTVASMALDPPDARTMADALCKFALHAVAYHFVAECSPPDPQAAPPAEDVVVTPRLMRGQAKIVVDFTPHATWCYLKPKRALYVARELEVAIGHTRRGGPIDG